MPISPAPAAEHGWRRGYDRNRVFAGAHRSVQQNFRSERLNGGDGVAGGAPGLLTGARCRVARPIGFTKGVADVRDYGTSILRLCNSAELIDGGSSAHVQSPSDEHARDDLRVARKGSVRDRHVDHQLDGIEAYTASVDECPELGELLLDMLQGADTCLLVPEPRDIRSDVPPRPRKLGTILERPEGRGRAPKPVPCGCSVAASHLARSEVLPRARERVGVAEIMEDAAEPQPRLACGINLSLIEQDAGKQEIGMRGTARIARGRTARVLAPPPLGRRPSVPS